MPTLAAIDIGTVSVRLAIASFSDGTLQDVRKITRICDLGEGVGATGRMSNAAIARVLQCVDDYLTEARAAGAEVACCTLTSAARDAANAIELLGGLTVRGLMPQVIPGEVEGSLTFMGVARDFPGQRILVADNGGGSTEFALGSMGAASSGIEWVRSIDVGCRRITERYLVDDDPPTPEAIRTAHERCAQDLTGISQLLANVPDPEKLVICGGTSTSLVAMELELEVYDSSRVHLHELTRAQVAELEERMAALTLARRRSVAGLQPQRAPVILGGIIVIGELMDACGMDRFATSESDLLFGLATAAGLELEGASSPLPWQPTLVEL